MQHSSPRQKTLSAIVKTLWISFAFATPFSATPAQAQQHPPPRIERHDMSANEEPQSACLQKKNTIGHRVISLEAKPLGTKNTCTLQRWLDTYLDDVKDAAAKQKDKERTAQSTLAIAITLLNERTRYAEANTLTECIATASCDCDTRALLLQSVAEQEHFPAAAVRSPFHLYLRIHEKGKPAFNIDPVTGTIFCDGTERHPTLECFGKPMLTTPISESAKKNNVYLHSLTPPEQNALILSNVGWELYLQAFAAKPREERQNKIIQAANYQHLALKENPQDPLIIYRSAVLDIIVNVYSASPPREAIKNATKAIETIELLDPRNALRFLLEGYVYTLTDNLDQAEKAYSKAARYSNNNPRLYFNLGYFFFTQGKFKKARSAFRKAQIRAERWNETLWQQSTLFLGHTLYLASIQEEKPKLATKARRAYQSVLYANPPFSTVAARQLERINELLQKEQHRHDNVFFHAKTRLQRILQNAQALARQSLYGNAELEPSSLIDHYARAQPPVP